MDAGLPLLRGLRVLEKQEKNVTLRGIIAQIALSIEGGSTFSESLAQHPKIFNRLFVNMVKAGELGGVLEVVLTRLSEFMEKAQKIKGKVIAAMFYPVAVMIVAVAIMGVLMVFVIPKFKDVFSNLLEGQQLPAFTRFVLGVSELIKDNILYTLGGIVVLVGIFMWTIHTKGGRRLWDKFKMKAPCPRKQPGHQQGRHRPLHPHARHAGQQRRAHSPGAQHREGNRRQRHRCQRRDGST